MANDRHPVHVTIFDRSGRKKITAYDDSMWGWPNEEGVTDYVMSNPAKKYPDHAVEVDDGSLAWRFRTGRVAGQTSVRLLRKPRKSTPSSERSTLRHATKATKAAPKSQREMYYDAERRAAEGNKTFLEMLPTMRRRDLEKLIEKRPSLWGRFAGYLTSGHVFVDDPPAGTRHHATKTSSAQLQREIDEVLAGGGDVNVGDRVRIIRVAHPEAGDPPRSTYVGKIGTIERVIKGRRAARLRLADGSVWESSLDNIALV
jgi:hypothetical protein